MALGFRWPTGGYIVLVSLSALAGCSSSGGSAPAQPATADIPVVPTSAQAPPARPKAPIDVHARLRFVWTDFHFEAGPSVVEVDGEQVVETYTDHPITIENGERRRGLVYRRAQYRLSKAEQAQLRKVLTAESFWALDARYSKKDIIDGTTQTFTVAVGDKRKDVYCYHEWPEPVHEVGVVLRSIRKAHEAERTSSPAVRYKEIEAALARADAAAKRAGRKMP